MSSLASGPRTLVELEEERAFLLASLEDLERERAAGDVDDADYRRLRDAYTARAAAVLRAIDSARAATPEAGPDAGAGAAEGHTAAADSAPAPPGGVRRRRTAPRRALGVLAVAGVAALAGALVASSAGERLPGDPSSGSITPTGTSADLERARRLSGEGRTLDAIKAYDAVLRREPRQPEALAYRGWLLRLAGRSANNRELVDRGLAFVQRAVAADPTYPDARFFLGAILWQDRNDPAGAVREFRAFLANDPPRAMVPVVEDSLRRALADVERAGGAGSGGGSGGGAQPPG